MPAIKLFVQNPRYLFYEVFRALTHYTMWLFSVCLQGLVFTYIYPIQFSWLLHTIILLMGRYLWIIVCLRVYTKSQHQSPQDFFDRFYKPDYLYRNLATLLVTICILGLSPLMVPEEPSGPGLTLEILFNTIVQDPYIFIILKIIIDVTAIKNRFRFLRGKEEALPPRHRWNLCQESSSCQSAQSQKFPKMLLRCIGDGEGKNGNCKSKMAKFTKWGDIQNRQFTRLRFTTTRHHAIACSCYT